MSRRREQSDTPERPDAGPLMDALGHRFSDPGLLDHALTHASAAPERADSNERLEFLGDRVLGLIVARMLFEAFPDEPEGKLGYRFSALARRETLARVAAGLGLGAFIRLGSYENQSGGRESESILANAMEAVIAALFLDGGLPAAERFVRGRWQALVAEDPTPPKDAKTLLQEWAQAAGRPVPDYVIVDQAGPDHAPVFTVEVRLEGAEPARSTGRSKQIAEQAAAEIMFRRVKGRP